MKGEFKMESQAIYKHKHLGKNNVSASLVREESPGVLHRLVRDGDGRSSAARFTVAFKLYGSQLELLNLELDIANRSPTLGRGGGGKRGRTEDSALVQSQ
jgi:hypothetical protein